MMSAAPMRAEVVKPTLQLRLYGYHVSSYADR
jgi:hypothetical protein